MAFIKLICVTLINDLVGVWKARKLVDLLARIIYNFGEPAVVPICGSYLKYEICSLIDGLVPIFKSEGTFVAISSN